jgi:diacylglycerol kinase family enzyme
LAASFEERPDVSDRIPAIVNVRSGTAEQALKALEVSGLFEIHSVEPTQIADVVKQLVARGTKRILVAGGDGTIGTAAGVLVGTDTELAVLPGGTLNHFARDLGIGGAADEALRIATGTSVRGVDVGVVNGHVFLNTSSVGAYVRFVRMREQLEARLGYAVASFIAALRILVQAPVIGVELEVDGHKHVYRSTLAFIGLGERELKVPSLGNRVHGGKRGLHVMVVQGRSRARFFALALAAVARGVSRMSHNPEFDSFIVDGLQLDVHRDSAIAVDGEIVRVHPPLEYSLKRDALRVVCPIPDLLAGNASKERREAPREGATARA